VEPPFPPYLHVFFHAFSLELFPPHEGPPYLRPTKGRRGPYWNCFSVFITTPSSCPSQITRCIFSPNVFFPPPATPTQCEYIVRAEPRLRTPQRNHSCIIPVRGFSGSLSCVKRKNFSNISHMSPQFFDRKPPPFTGIFERTSYSL